MYVTYCCAPECQKLSEEKRPQTIWEYTILLPEQHLELIISGLWEHYATEHKIWPRRDVREKVLAAKKALIEKKRWKGGGREIVSLYFVQYEEGKYTMYEGFFVDTAFIEKLKQLLANAEFFYG